MTLLDAPFALHVRDREELEELEELEIINNKKALSDALELYRKGLLSEEFINLMTKKVLEIEIRESIEKKLSRKTSRHYRLHLPR